MNDKKEHYMKVFRKYLPEEFVEYVTDLVLRDKFVFKIVPGRKTKLGDFRVDLTTRQLTITINGDLNPYQFLITTLHEIAHLETYKKHGTKVQPHGNEWKTLYANLLMPLIESAKLPRELHTVVLESIYNPKAASCSDVELSRALKKFDKNQNELLLEQLPFNTIFELDGRVFKKGNLRRKRFECIEIKTGKMYLIHALAGIKHRNNE